MLSDDDWRLEEKISEKLKLFYNVTELFSMSKYPTVNCYFLKICEVREALYVWILDESDVIRRMTATMMKKIEKYWSVCHIMMAVAVVLNPKYKMMIVEYYFPIIYGCESEREIDKVRETCYDMLK